MKLFQKILLFWIGIISVYVACLTFFPHNHFSADEGIMRFIEPLLFLVSLYIFIKEPNRRSKFIFLNFSIFFFLAFFRYGLDFVGVSFWTTNKYASHLYYQYLCIVNIVMLSVAIIYLVFDLVFQDFKTYQKYLCTIGLVLIFSTMEFYSFIADPLYLYSTQEIKQWKSLDQALDSIEQPVTSAKLANKVTLQSWVNGKAVGDLYPQENIKRIEELMPFLSRENDNWRTLLWQPMYKSLRFMDLLLIGFILLYFGYQYQKDPPQGAYIDKIMFLLLLFCSMETLHNWAFINSLAWDSLNELFQMGHYVTVFIEMFLAIFFAMRLRFITSVQGEFYETELAANPHQVTRWRDWIDEIVLAQFFNLKFFNSRLFEDSSKK